MASASMIVTWKIHLQKVIPLVVKYTASSMEPQNAPKLLSSAAFSVQFPNFAWGKSVAVFFLFEIKGCFRAWWVNFYAVRRGLFKLVWLGLIAGLSAIAAGFSPLRCRWLSTDFPDPCVRKSMALFFTLFSWSTAYKNEISSAETESKQAQMK